MKVFTMNAAAAAMGLCWIILFSANASPQTDVSHGLSSRPAATPWLLMPPTASSGSPPLLLSQTGAFKDTAHLVPAEALIPYDLNVPFWSDGAAKRRWISLPKDGKIAFQTRGPWGFPRGTIFVKHFEMAVDEMHPGIKRRLETRLLVCDSDGGVYGVTYKWRSDDSDADLLTTNLSEPVVIKTATGTRTQTWYYPSRQDCMTCHTARAGLVLGVKAEQLNRDLIYPSGIAENELRAWNDLGLFDRHLSDTELASCPSLARSNDPARSLEDRARSYLDANCSQCHRPGGTVAYFDTRYDTPLAQQDLVAGQILIDEGIDGARVIAPNDIWRSILFMRANSVGDIKMPPLAHNRLDPEGMQLLRQWIESLPGPMVLPPPAITPPQGNYDKPIEVTLRESEPGATIHYTLDGSLPTTNDAVYDKPIKLTGPAIVRAKAYKPGFKRSITAQQVFVIGG
jgi:uncharacterized repeat protein (TIGR03806 family)